MNGWVNGGGSLGDLMRQLVFQAHTNDTAVTSGLQPALCAHVTARGPVSPGQGSTTRRICSRLAGSDPSKDQG